MMFIAAGIVSQVGGYFCMTYAPGHIPASIVSPTMVASPVISALLAIPIAGENLSIFQISGGLLVDYWDSYWSTVAITQFAQSDG